MFVGNTAPDFGCGLFNDYWIGTTVTKGPDTEADLGQGGMRTSQRSAILSFLNGTLMGTVAYDATVVPVDILSFQDGSGTGPLRAALATLG